MFSCEFCKIFKNSFFFPEHLRWLFLYILVSKLKKSEICGILVYSFPKSTLKDLSIALIRGSRSKMYCKKALLKDSSGNICAAVSLLIKLQACMLQFYQKCYSGLGFFLNVLWIFSEKLFYRTAPGDRFLSDHLEWFANGNQSFIFWVWIWFTSLLSSKADANLRT